MCCSLLLSAGQYIPSFSVRHSSLSEAIHYSPRMHVSDCHRAVSAVLTRVLLASRPRKIRARRSVGKCPRVRKPVVYQPPAIWSGTECVSRAVPALA